MPRNISGTYTLAPGNPVVTGTIIEAAWANPTLSDIANALTDSLSRSGSGGMLVPFRNADGTVGGPGMSWVNEPTSGWYRAALNDFWYSVGNENIFRITKAGVELAPGKGAINFTVPNRVQDTDPAPVPTGTGWFESDTGNYYIRYQNPDLTFTYIQTNTAVQGIPLALVGAPNGVASLDNTGNVPPSQLGNAIPITQKGAPLGVATLDAAGKVPAAQIPVSGGIPTFTDLFVTGKTVLGSGVGVGGSSGFEYHATLGGASVFQLNRWQAVVAGVPLIGNKSRSGVIGVHTIVQNADSLLTITGAGSDGVAFLGAGGILFEVDGVPVVGNMPGRIRFNTTNQATGISTEAFRITQAQVMVVGGAGALTVGPGGNVARFQLHGTDASTARISTTRWSADVNAATVTGGKSKGAVIGTHGLVADGDNVFSLLAVASDGVGFIQSGSINFFIDGVPGLNDMPGRIQFATTPDGSTAPVEAMRIDNAGRMIISPGGGTPAVGTAGFQYHTATGLNAVTTWNRWQAGTPAALFIIGNKCRSGVIGSHAGGIVQDADVLFNLSAGGSDGTAFITAANITFAVDGVPGVGDMPGRIVFSTVPDGTAAVVEAMRIDNAQRLVIGGTASIAGGGNSPRVQVHEISGTQQYGAYRWQAAAGGSQINGFKSRGAAIGTHTIVNDQDSLSIYQGFGSDGVGFIPAGSMIIGCDGAPGVNDMPGMITFNTTPDGAVAVVARVKIGQQGNVILNMQAALATAATGGFTYIPTCAGAPTGVPAVLPAGAAPMVINTTANKLMFYSTGAWRDAGP